MANGEENKIGWLGYLRLITPLGIFVLGVFNTQMNNSISEIKKDVRESRQEMFHHLTNDEMHTPRSLAIMQPEFKTYQKLRDEQMTVMNQSLCEIKNILELHRRESRR